MVGYPEALTDPSYAGQILVLTYPLIGNYGVPSDELDEYGLPKYFESNKLHIRALIISDYTEDPSHYTAVMSLGAWLKKNGIPGLYGVDTRAVTKHVRTQGACLGKVVFGSNDVPFEDPNLVNLVAAVSRKSPETYGVGNKYKVVVLDCGCKNNIIRCLVKMGMEVTVVPFDYDISKLEYDGILISNGPGDPTMATVTIETIKRCFKEDKPIMGICLGNQIMALAAGAKTYKMKFGNRGMNQPCIDLRTTLCYITPQNHGYAVDASSLPADWNALFINANDQSNEGPIHAF
jgi:carbamoyl-phosphate synthase small subunit